LKFFVHNSHSDQSTLKTGIDEIRQILTYHITDSERLNLIFSLLSEENEHIKKSTKKEYIKMYGIIAEIFSKNVLEFFPKILSILNKKIKEGQGHYNETIADVIGKLAEYSLRGLDTTKSIQLLNFLLHSLYLNLTPTNKKNAHIGSAMCIFKIIQNTPVDCLSIMLDDIVEKITIFLNDSTCFAHAQLLEGILSLILAVESKFTSCLPNILPSITNAMKNTEWLVRKLALDIIYTLAVILPDSIREFLKDLTIILNAAKFDKIKKVRETAIMA